ncbi:ThuA domain-containing protein [Pelagibacterium xiamenense]|uniref:ThuA domain-containing protein n=1 Tax=Pelagibacterium xiamenense TaxID=2901140 RepID=UPI001E489D12|nr:ThuA domain-containing protein [Pelagibacterium xiamenense]MCD7059576.1 ThuA domain-containing protein [Pelagibacterium xiamenense]
MVYRSMKRAFGAAACVLALSGVVGGAFAQEDMAGPEPRYTTFEKYGFCGSVDETCYNAWFDRTSGDEEPWKVLIFYHVAPGVGPHDNREAGVSVLEDMLEAEGYEVTSTQDPADLESGFRLRPYDAIVFFNTGRDAVSSLGMMALRIYIEGGGGFVGIHNAFGTNFNDTWFEGLLGAQLFDHGPRQTGTVISHSDNDVSVAHLDGVEFGPEEFYNVHPDPRWLSDVRVLLSVDNATRTEGVSGYYGHPGMGETNPVSWCHYYDGGRAWVTTLGHSVEILVDENWRQHILGGIDGVMGKEPFCQE